MTIHFPRSHLARWLCPLLIVGCTATPQEHLPTYPWRDSAAAIAQMDARSKLVQSINCACTLTLIRADGQSARLDGALAMDLPQKKVRIRAWKFNQPVFDLTFVDNALWLESPRDQQKRTAVLPAGLDAAQLARALSLLDPDFFNDPRLEVLDSGGADFALREPIDPGKTMTARVQRSTLTIREYRLLDTTSHSQFHLDLSGYQSIANIVWPTRLTGISNGSRIELELRDVQINTPLPATAFTPPHRAQRLP